MTLAENQAHVFLYVAVIYGLCVVMWWYLYWRKHKDERDIAYTKIVKTRHRHCYSGASVGWGFDNPRFHYSYEKVQGKANVISRIHYKSGYSETVGAMTGSVMFDTLIRYLRDRTRLNEI